jgi:hypothetical protein
LLRRALTLHATPEVRALLRFVTASSRRPRSGDDGPASGVVSSASK